MADTVALLDGNSSYPPNCIPEPEKSQPGGESHEEDYLVVQKALQQVKDGISQTSKKNFKLERDLKFLDSKIALLINHKITLAEVESHLHDGPQMPVSLKELHHRELYGELFLLLQTTPEYIAKLSRLVSQREIDGLLQIVMFALYGNQYENREEHHLLSMFEYALTYEVQEATEINSLMRANTAITRMMTTYCRRGPGQEYVRSCLGEIIQELVDFKQSLEIDPLRIFQNMIDNDEVQRPDESKTLLQEAGSNAVVQRRIQDRIPVLQQFVLRILERLKATLDSVPYGIRWLCKATRALVQEKFPEASAERINSFIGGFFILRYINPIVATPYAYRLLQTPPTRQSSRNLTLVAKLIQKLANTSSVRENITLPLEPFVKAHTEELKTFLSDLCEVPDFHEQLQLEEYIAASRKDISIEISLSEIALIQSFLLKYRDSIVSSSTDKLIHVLDRLPDPSDEMERNKVQTHLRLSQRLSDPGVSNSPLVCLGSSMNVADQMASARRKCKHLLIHLFKMTPRCMHEHDIQSALRVAQDSPLEEVVTHADVISEQLKTLEQLGGLNNRGKDLYDEIRAILPNQIELLSKSRGELRSLQRVQETITEHSEVLEEQLEAYRAYLDAVRAKVGEVQPQGGYMFKKSRGAHKFSHSQLEKDGVIQDTPGIPLHRRGMIVYSISCDEPGIYSVNILQRGSQRVIFEKQLHLEDLLEMQHQQEPVIDMEGLVVLNVRRTLLLLSRYFMRRDQRPMSRQFSTATIQKT